MQWQLVHHETTLLPYGYRVVTYRDSTEIVLRDEWSAEDLVANAKSFATANGLIVLSASLWAPQSEVKSRRWLHDVTVAFDPSVYPYGVTPEIVSSLMSSLSNSLDIVATGIGDKVIGEETLNVIRDLTEFGQQAMEFLKEALPVIIIVIVMMTVMNMMR